MFLIPDFMGKRQGATFGKAPRGRRASRAAQLGFVVFHLSVEILHKQAHGNRFLFRRGPTNFWPQIENWIWVVLALHERPSLGLFFFNSIAHYWLQQVHLYGRHRGIWKSPSKLKEYGKANIDPE